MKDAKRENDRRLDDSVLGFAVVETLGIQTQMQYKKSELC